MTKEDRNHIFALLGMREMILNWMQTEFNEKDRTKLKIICDNILALGVQWRKREGEVAFDTMLEEIEKYSLALIPNEEAKKEDCGTIETKLLIETMKEIEKDNIQCLCCDRCDYTKCAWYTVNNLIGKEKHEGKNKCPYCE